MSLQTFTKAYIECALWSSADTTEDGKEISLDDGEHELAPETRAKMESDCAAFYEAQGELLTYDNIKRGTEDVDASAGYDFWLTRCGHGAGFWDGDWAEPAASVLDSSATAFGNVDLYIGDDGKIYC